METLIDETVITLSPKSLRSAIADLQKAIDTHKTMKEHLEAVLKLQSRRGKSGTTGARGGRARGRKGQKTLRQAILDVLAESKEPLKPIQLKHRLLESGYTTAAKPQNFYISVFSTAAKEPAIRKTKAGFQLRTRARRKPSGAARRPGRRKKS